MLNRTSYYLYLLYILIYLLVFFFFCQTFVGYKYNIYIIFIVLSFDYSQSLVATFIYTRVYGLFRDLSELFLGFKKF